MGLIFDFSSKNSGVLKCIPGVKLSKYTYTLIHVNQLIQLPPIPQIAENSDLYQSFLLKVLSPGNLNNVQCPYKKLVFYTLFKKAISLNI